MASVSDWKVPASAQPKSADYAYDLDLALSAMVALRATVPADAFTAETLGTERAGNGVFIRGNGLVLTIGYLITEAETIWLTLSDGRSVPGHVLGYDQETGFGLVQALAKLDVPRARARRVGGGLGRRACRGRRRRRTASIGRRTHRRQAGIRRLLGIRARRGDLHRAGASELGRHRADRTRRRSARHRLAAAAAGRREGAGAEHQHDRADRPAEADPRRPDEVRPAQRAGAAVARPLRDRGGEPARRRRPRRPRTGQARRPAHRRHRARRRRQRSARSRRLLPRRLGARQGRRRSAAHNLSATATPWSCA